jgi:GTP cyclohydrolase II
MTRKKQMTVLNQAKEHFRAQLANGMKEISVPEWNTTIYYKPQTTFAQQSKVIKLHSEGKLAEALVETLMYRALDKDGKNMFNFGDKDVLMREVDPNIIIKICTAMNDTGEGDQALGN